MGKTGKKGKDKAREPVDASAEIEERTVPLPADDSDAAAGGDGVSREQYQLLLDEAQAVERERVRLEEELVKREISQAEIQRDLVHAQRDLTRYEGLESESEATRRRLEGELAEAVKAQAVMATRLERLDELRERVNMLEETNNKLAFALKDSGDGFKQFLLSPPSGGAGSALRSEPAAPWWKRPVLYQGAAGLALVAWLIFAVFDRMHALESSVAASMHSESKAADEERAKLQSLVSEVSAGLGGQLEAVVQGQSELRAASVQAAEAARLEYERSLVETRGEVRELFDEIRAVEASRVIDDQARARTGLLVQRADRLARSIVQMRARLAAVPHPESAAEKLERVGARVELLAGTLWASKDLQQAEAELEALEAECTQLEAPLMELERSFAEQRRREQEEADRRAADSAKASDPRRPVPESDGPGGVTMDLPEAPAMAPPEEGLDASEPLLDVGPALPLYGPVEAPEQEQPD